MANPEILQVSKEMNEHVEASPNLPGVSAAIKGKMIIKSSYKMRLPNLKTFQSDEMKFYY